jgi:hypothetical protein
MRSASGRKPRREGRSAGWILMLLALPLALNAVLALWGGSPATVAGSAASFTLFIAAAMLARRAADAATGERGRRFAVRRRWPWKRLAGAMTALATAIAAYAAAGIDPLTALLYGIGAGAGFFMAYGWTEDGAGAPPPHSAALGDEVRAALDEGYRRLEQIEAARAQLALPEFQSRLGNISVGVERILQSIETDPENLRRARKFLSVYLDGARKVAEQYARTQGEQQSSVEREQNFRTLLVDMENTCQEQYEKLQKREMLDLDVQIEVLSQRLRREGIG